MRSSTSSSDGGPSRAPGKSLAATAAAVALAALAAERAPVPDPILTGSAQSMGQYESLQAHVRRDGPQDFIVLGNSLTRQGVDPRVLTAGFRERTGREAKGFNFAWGGVSSPMFPYQTRLAYGVDRPPLCVFVVTPPMIAVWTSVDDVRARTFIESPYGAALEDPRRWRGALKRASMDHVRLFRLRYGIKNRILGGEPEKRRVGAYRDVAGFAVIGKDDEEIRWSGVARRYRAWTMGAEQRDAMAEAVRIARSHGARVVLVEAPRHPRLPEHVPDLAPKLRAYREALHEIAADAGADVLLLDDALRLDDADFLDPNHLNELGAAAFSRWLADRLPPPIGSE